MAKVIMNYLSAVIECGCCGKEHDNQQDAESCCAFYMCRTCRKEYVTHQEAFNCCKEKGSKQND